MNKLLLLIPLTILLLTSCSQKSGFKSIYKDNKGEVDLALTIPRWAAFTVLPKDVKEDIRDITKGMRRLKALINEEGNNVQLKEQFSELASQDIYTEYIKVTSKGDNINILALEERDHVRELILYADSDDTTVLIGVLGKMPKAQLLKEISNVARDN